MDRPDLDQHWAANLTFGDLPGEAARHFGDREALCFRDRRYSFRQISLEVDRLARGFIHIGVTPGERVCLWLTNCPEWIFAMFALAKIEDELLPESERSHLVETLDRRMVERPQDWRNHYHGDERELRLLRRYALSDRCRYYWGDAEVKKAVDRLVDNLRRHVPPSTLLSQYLPEQYRAVVEGRLQAEPLALARHKVFGRLAEYARACARNAAGPR